jgi:putative ABC transport system ATP-binding protein
MSEELIRMQQVTKVFQTDELETHALSNIELTIRKGDYVTIAGPSGGGKSTLLSILGLLDQPTSGTYRLASRAVEKLSRRDRAGIRNQQVGFVFQSFNLIGDLTVAENVELPLTFRSMSHADRTRRVRDALERVEMLHRINHFPAQLSGGQQQRVAVARAIVTNPAILLADEPTGNLDSRNGELVMGLLARLHAEGTTICMVTHDPRYARQADRTLHLFDGTIVEDVRAAESAYAEA